MTLRQSIRVRQGEGTSHREFFHFPIGHLGVKDDSQLHGFALFFLAIWIRVDANIGYHVLNTFPFSNVFENITEELIYPDS
jgi:hypothetical protein